MPFLWQPPPLIRVAAPFDAPDWLFELKHDGFRSVAVIDGHRCTLVSRGGHVFRQWPQLAEELAHSVRAKDAVLAGEVCCLRPDGRSDFNALLFRRGWPYFYAFDLLSLEGRDLRALPLRERKRRLRGVMPRGEGHRLRYVEDIEERGCDLYGLACEHDLEGIVAKSAGGCYHRDGLTTNWLKIKNPAYSPGRRAPRASSADVGQPGAGRSLTAWTPRSGATQRLVDGSCRAHLTPRPDAGRGRPASFERLGSQPQRRRARRTQTKHALARLRGQAGSAVRCYLFGFVSTEPREPTIW